MSIITTASGIMGFSEENSLRMLDKVPVGATGINYLFSVVNPTMEVGMAYDFNFVIDRRKAQKVSFTEDGRGEFALFGHYKGESRIITEGQFRYLLHRDNIKLLLRVPLTDKVDFEYLAKASFELVVKGLTQSETLIYTGTDTRTMDSLQEESSDDEG